MFLRRRLHERCLLQARARLKMLERLRSFANAPIALQCECMTLARGMGIYDTAPTRSPTISRLRYLRLLPFSLNLRYLSRSDSAPLFGISLLTGCRVIPDAFVTLIDHLPGLTDLYLQFSRIMRWTVRCLSGFSTRLSMGGCRI